MKNNETDNRPDLASKWFWDFDYYRIDWQASYRTIIARIIERGSEKEWQEIIRFYGRDRVLNTLKNEITFFPDYAIEKVSKYFAISKEELLSYRKKKSEPKHWI